MSQELQGRYLTSTNRSESVDVRYYASCDFQALKSASKRLIERFVPIVASKTVALSPPRKKMA